MHHVLQQGLRVRQRQLSKSNERLLVSRLIRSRVILDKIKQVEK